MSGYASTITKLIRLSILVTMATWVTAAVHGQDEFAGIKCVMNAKKAASKDASVEYKGGKVYFCCDHCADAFREDVKLKDKAKYTIKANHQLVLTGQYVQTGCPMSGGEFDKEQMINVGGTKIGFCCDGCRDKVKNAEDLAAKSKLVFSEVAFKKAFKKPAAKVNLKDVKCMMVGSKDVSEKNSADYKGGKVYFCCGGCVKKFEAAPEKFAVNANQQLVATGQLVQVGCPISGGDVDESQTSEVGGVSVKFCCEKCKAKVDGAKTPEAKAELVFGEKRFSKAFAKQ